MFIQITPEIQEIFLDRVKTLLEQGQTSQIVKTSNKKSVKFLINEDEQEVPVEVTRTVETNKQTTLNPTPNWVLQMVANSMSIQSATDYLTSKGYMVVDPSVVQNEKEDLEQSNGLSDFAVRQIRAKLLGIEEDVEK